jgi:hypothetical protein
MRARGSPYKRSLVDFLRHLRSGFWRGNSWIVFWLAMIGFGLSATAAGASPRMATGDQSTSALVVNFERESRHAQAAITACGDEDLHCIASALDRYADAIRVLTPKPLLGLPDVVSHAARRIRRAKTKAQAVAAMRRAVAEVRGTICLLKADDPMALNAETRAASFVTETLDVATSKLEKAVGL